MDAETVARIARLARLELSAEETERFARQLGDILEHFRALSELDTDDVEPAVYAVDLEGRTREDEEAPGPDRDELMQNCRPDEQRRDGLYVVPRVIE